MKKELRYLLLAFLPVFLFLFVINTNLFGTGLISLDSNATSKSPNATDLAALYGKCDGQPFETDCADLSCISQGSEQRVYNTWKERFKQIHNLSDEYFNDHIKIRDVFYDVVDVGSKEKHRVFIYYTYENDWVISRQNEAVVLTEDNDIFPADTISDSSLIKKLNLEIETAEGFDRDVISWEDAKKAMTTTYKDKSFDYDFCHIDFTNVSGELSIEGFTTLDENKNKCAKAFLNLNNGDIDVHDDYCYLE